MLQGGWKRGAVEHEVQTDGALCRVYPRQHHANVLLRRIEFIARGYYLRSDRERRSSMEIGRH